MAANGSHSGRHDADAVLIAALAAGATRDDAAQQASVSARTVYRRLDDAQFRARLDEAREELIAIATWRLGAAASTAVDVLCALMMVENPPNVRLSASRTILDQAQRWRSIVDLEVRLSALEAATSAR